LRLRAAVPGDQITSSASEGAEQDAVDAARRAIHELFEQGCIDANHATAALLAIDLGRHRVAREGGRHHTPTDFVKQDRGAR
jgi:hypothetical protein